MGYPPWLLPRRLHPLVITEEETTYNRKVICLLALATLVASTTGLLADGYLGALLGLVFSVVKFALGGRAKIRIRTIRRIEP